MLKASLQPDEYKTLELKYSCLPMRDLNEEELFVVVNALFTKIHVITGWAIPKDDLLPVFTDQFGKKLLEDYPTLNREEIEAAFRKNSGRVKDWGRSFNLGLLEEVLELYMESRAELSKLEEAMRDKIEHKQLPPAPMAEQETIDTAWEIWSSTGRFEYISDTTYSILENNSLLTLSTEEKKLLMSAANSYMKEAEARDGTQFSGVEWMEYQKRYAKKIAVANLFKIYKTKNERPVIN